MDHRCRRSSSHRRTVRGQVLPITALMSGVILGLAALAIDASSGRDVQLRSQYSADSSALSAAKLLSTESLSRPPSYSNASPDPGILRAEQIAYLEGVTTDGANACVSTGGSPAQTDVVYYDVTPQAGCTPSSAAPAAWINKVEVMDPPSGSLPSACSPTYYCVSVTITRHQPTYLAGSIGFSRLTITATSIAAIGSSTVLPCGACMLGTSGTALNIANNGSLQVTNSAVDVNSSGNPAISVSNNATLKGTSIADVGVTSCSNNATCSPAPNDHAGTVPDPYAGVPYPSVNCTSSCPNGPDTSCGNNGNCIINPGVYHNISASNNATLTLATGNYVITGCLCASNNVVVQSGAGGVLLYFTCTGYSAPGTLAPCPSGQSPSTSCGTSGLSASNNDDFSHLNPQTSGTYQGMVIMFDRNDPSPICFSNNAGGPSQGTIYAKNSHLDLSNNGGLTMAMVVVNSADIANNATIKMSISGAAPVNWGSSGGAGIPTIVG